MRCCKIPTLKRGTSRSEEHTSELQSRLHLVCRLLLEKIKLQMLMLSAFGLMMPHIESHISSTHGPLALISVHATSWDAITFFRFVTVGEISAHCLVS